MDILQAFQNIKNRFCKNNYNNVVATDCAEKLTDESTVPFSYDTTTISLEEAMRLYKPDFIPRQRVISQDDLNRYILYSVALGDIAGSQYEGVPYPEHSVSEILAAVSSSNRSGKCEGGMYPVYEGYKTIDMFTEFNHITDDTILTIAVYKATQKIKSENVVDEDEIVKVYTEYLREYFNLYPNAGYAGGFEGWALKTMDRNFSYGNGACMRVGGIAALFDDVEDVIKYAYCSALPSHSHTEGIKGAVCTAVIYWMLAYGATKDDVLKYIQKQYPSDNGRDINGATTMQKLVDMNRVNPWSTLTVICQTSLVEAVINFIDSNSFEECIRNSYRYLCDRDTIGSISGPMAALYYQDMSVGGEPDEEIVRRYFNDKLWKDIHM